MLNTRTQRLDRNKITGLQAVLDRALDNKKIRGTAFALKQGDQYWQGASGDLAIDQPYFIASVSKLYTTALILQLKARDLLSLEDKIVTYLDDGLLPNFAVYRGKSYADVLTIRHLLSHTSGLPDYFQGKGAHKKTLLETLTEGNDQAWTYEQVLESVNNKKLDFEPGKKKKAKYSDTNFQLLGKIIEHLSGVSFAKNCLQSIIQPLGLAQTYLYEDPGDTRPKTLYYRSKQLHIPRAMASFRSDGGIVSTSPELLLFLEAFFTGKLFPLEYIRELQVWNRIFFPFRAGVGIQLLKLPWLLNPTGSAPEFIGHAGLSGALAFYSPERKLFVAGTINQIADPGLAVKTLFRLSGQVK